MAVIIDTPSFIWVVCNKLATVRAPTKNCSLAEFSGPYGVTKYGSGWRKDVVNQCLEFDSVCEIVSWCVSVCVGVGVCQCVCLCVCQCVCDNQWGPTHRPVSQFWRCRTVRSWMISGLIQYRLYGTLGPASAAMAAGQTDCRVACPVTARHWPVRSGRLWTAPLGFCWQRKPGNWNWYRHTNQVTDYKKYIYICKKNKITEFRNNNSVTKQQKNKKNLLIPSEMPTDLSLKAHRSVPDYTKKHICSWLSRPVKNNTEIDTQRWCDSSRRACTDWSTDLHDDTEFHLFLIWRWGGGGGEERIQPLNHKDVISMNMTQQRQHRSLGLWSVTAAEAEKYSSV